MESRLQKFLTLSIFLILLFAMFNYLFLDKYSGEKSKIGALLGKKVPYFEYKYADNDEVFISAELNEFHKKYKLINFFASWCSTCLIDHKELIKLKDDEDIALFGVIWRDSYKAAKMWLFQQGNPYDILLIDKQGVSKKQFKLIGVPESFLLDANNNIVSHYRGPINAEAIKEIVKVLKNN